MIDLEAIRKRNARRIRSTGCLCDECGAVRDIDALLEEIERLQDPLLCMCGMPEDIHTFEDGLGYTWLPGPVGPQRTTLHAVHAIHRSPAEASWFGKCRHGKSFHPQSCMACWQEAMDCTNSVMGGNKP